MLCGAEERTVIPDFLRSPFECRWSPGCSEVRQKFGSLQSFHMKGSNTVTLQGLRVTEDEVSKSPDMY